MNHGLQGQYSCSVTAVFDVSGNEAVFDALKNADMPCDDEIIIKRTMQADGRSSIKLNGEQVTAQMLRRITALLVDVHGQSDHFALLNKKNQLELLDAIAGDRSENIKNEISAVLSKLSDVDERLSKLGGSKEDRAKRLDFIEFCIGEIERVDFKENEDEELLSRRKKLQNFEKIAAAVSAANAAINGEGGATDLIGESVRSIDKISAFGEEYPALSDRLSAVLDELDDIAETLSDSFDIEFDPAELDVIENRIDEINRIKKKYGGDYLSVKKTLEDYIKEREILSDSGVEAEKLLAKSRALKAELSSVYDKLTKIRKKTAEELSEKLREKLSMLAMKGALFSVDFKKIEDAYSRDGNDDIEFMFSANVGEDVKPLSKIVSGGELSRLMLAIKSVGFAGGAATYIFDEIDAGISGRTAFVVAESFVRISKNVQIIAVSHLPQIVAYSDTSYYIYKKEADGRTNTFVSELAEDEKVKEVIRLVGGKEGDEASFAHAKNLISEADKFKSSL